MASSALDRAIYSYADVDRLVGLHAGTARRWLEGYERAGRFYDPVLRPAPTGVDVVTWGELVEARLLAEFRLQDVPVQRMRPAIVRLREEFGPYPLAHARPFLDVEGCELGSSPGAWCLTFRARGQIDGRPRLSKMSMGLGSWTAAAQATENLRVARLTRGAV